MHKAAVGSQQAGTKLKLRYNFAPLPNLFPAVCSCFFTLYSYRNATQFVSYVSYDNIKRNMLNVKLFQQYWGYKFLSDYKLT